MVLPEKRHGRRPGSITILSAFEKDQLFWSGVSIMFYLPMTSISLPSKDHAIRVDHIG